MVVVRVYRTKEYFPEEPVKDKPFTLLRLFKCMKRERKQSRKNNQLSYQSIFRMIHGKNDGIADRCAFGDCR